MRWMFEPLPPNLVEVEVTQRDQFRNDDVELASALVRENVQNAMDAGSNSNPVLVTFNFAGTDTGLDSDYIKSLFEGHAPHLEASRCGTNEVDFGEPHALIIEDFNTTGLTGSLETKDNCNFSDFWRRHGQSHKGGKSGGRWGLGKLVYSSSSQLNSFFGLTYRDGDECASLMGQTVLANHTLEGVRYPAHSFFADTNDQNNMSIPIKDTDIVDEFIRQFGLTRNKEPGLSVIIPFPYQEISMDSMIQAGIDNYFYPIITGQLILRFGDVEINSRNIGRLALQHSNDPKLTSALFEFIEELHALDDSRLMKLRPSWLDNSELDENDFEPKDLSRIRNEFSAGQLIGLELPLTLKPQSGPPQETQIKVYLKRPPGLSHGRDLYVRGCLTVPAEAKFHSRKAFGAMVADHEPIAAFLADAENPAHTKWTQTTEKLRRNYKAPQKQVRAIQYAVRQLYDVLAGIVEEEDKESLKKFFWTDIEDSARGRTRRKESPPRVEPDIEPHRKPLRLDQVEGGFAIYPTKDLSSDLLPLNFKVRVAYNVMKGSPFKAHVPWDFDFTGKKGPAPKVHATARIVSYNKELTEPNCIGFTVVEPDFAIRVSGFDKNRDLVLSLQTVEDSD